MGLFAVQEKKRINDNNKSEHEQAHKATPGGMSSTSDSIESANSSKKSTSIFIKVFSLITNPITYILKNVNDMLISIYRFFFPKKPSLSPEKLLSDLKKEIEIADSFSDELILKRSSDNPVTFTRYGEHLVKNYGLFRKCFFHLKRLLRLKSYYELGKIEGTKNPKQLIPHYKETCQFFINMLANNNK